MTQKVLAIDLTFCSGLRKGINKKHSKQTTGRKSFDTSFQGIEAQLIRCLFVFSFFPGGPYSRAVKVGSFVKLGTQQIRHYLLRMQGNFRRILSPHDCKSEHPGDPSTRPLGPGWLSHLNKNGSSQLARSGGLRLHLANAC